MFVTDFGRIFIRPVRRVKIGHRITGMDRRSRHLAILPWDIYFYLRIHLGANSTIFVVFRSLSRNKTTAFVGEYLDLPTYLNLFSGFFLFVFDPSIVSIEVEMALLILCM